MNKTALQLVEELAASREQKEAEDRQAEKQKREKQLHESREFWAPITRIIDEVRFAHPDCVTEIRFEGHGFPWFACVGDVFRLERLINGVRITSGYRGARQETAVDALIPYVISLLADAVRYEQNRKTHNS